MQQIEIIVSIVMSSLAVGGVIIGAIVTLTKFSTMTKANKCTLAGYKNTDGSPIFRSVGECVVIHTTTTQTTCKKIDETKAKIVELRGDIRRNEEKSVAMFLQIKEFMGSTVAAINNLKEVTTRKNL